MSEIKKDISSEDIYKLLQAVQNQNIEINTKLNKIEEINSKLENIENILSKEVNELKQKTCYLDKENIKLKEDLLVIRKQNKRYNIIDHGIENRTNIEETIHQIFSENLGIPLGNFRDVFRIGKKAHHKTRPV